MAIKSPDGSYSYGDQTTTGVMPPPAYTPQGYANSNTPGPYNPNVPWVAPPGNAQAIQTATRTTQSTPNSPQASSSTANGGAFGGGWDQFATDPSTPQGALKAAIGQGLTGQAAVDAANTALGLQPPNSIAFNADGTYGLPNGYYVAPNPSNPGALDLISRGGGSGGGTAGPYGTNGFMGSPGYAYEQQAAQNAVQASAAARGTLLSTGTLKDLQGTAAGIAGQAFALDTGNLFNLAGLGQNATNAAAGYTVGGANAQAAGTVGGANSIIGGANGLSNAALTGYIYNNLNPSSASPSYGTTPGQIPGYGPSTYPLGHG